MYLVGGRHMYPHSGCLLWACRSHLTLGESSNTFLEVEMLHIRTSSSNYTKYYTLHEDMEETYRVQKEGRLFHSLRPTTSLRPRFSENWGSARLEEVGDLPTPLLPSSIPRHMLMKKIR